VVSQYSALLQEYKRFSGSVNKIDTNKAVFRELSRTHISKRIELTIVKFSGLLVFVKHALVAGPPAELGDSEEFE
jgi:hypothetical protein